MTTILEAPQSRASAGYRYYTGAPNPAWLWNETISRRLFVSYGRLAGRKSPFPAATVPGWALDSAGYTMTRDHGRWIITAGEYMEFIVRRAVRQIGRLDFAAPQDWVCTRLIVDGGYDGGQKFTGTRTFIDPAGRMTYEEIVAEHQRLTVASYRELNDLWARYRAAGECDGRCPVIPVLQGVPGDPVSYRRCRDLYQAAGVDLAAAPLVGVGSVVTIQDTPAIRRLARGLAPLGLRLHWFGVKSAGLPLVWPHAASSDSMSWSREARWEPRRPGCTHVVRSGAHQGEPSNCANCPRYAGIRAADMDTLAAGLSARPCFEQDELFDADTLSGGQAA